jgi:hypothetical protein
MMACIAVFGAGRRSLDHPFFVQGRSGVHAASG